MGQVTIYLPEPLLAQIRKKAREAHKSVSAYMADLAKRDARSEEWPRSFVTLYGSCEGGLPEMEDLPPEAVEPL